VYPSHGRSVTLHLGSQVQAAPDQDLVAREMGLSGAHVCDSGRVQVGVFTCDKGEVGEGYTVRGLVVQMCLDELAFLFS
jgi:hypothetical protein